MSNTTYKKTTIGLIPNDWEVKKLNGVFKVNAGGDINSANVSNIRNETFKYPIYANAEKNNGFYGFANIYKIDYDCLTVTGRGDLGIAVARFEKFYPIVRLLILTPIKKVDLIYYENLINSLTLIQESTGVPQLTAPQISHVIIPVPPLPEQQKIASILSTWDVAIDNCKEIIEELKVRNKGLVNKLIIDNGELNVKLGNVFVESKIPSVNADVNKRITVRLTLKGIEKRGVRGSELEEATYYYLRKSGQFVYGKQNLHKGAFGIIPDELDGFESSSDIPAFDINKEFNSKYIFYYFSRRHFYEKLEDISTGTGSKRIQPKELYKVEIKVPSTLEKQNAIVKIIDTATKELNQYQQKLQTLQLQKKGLMQQLLTGKVRVKI
jgi:type I restriction enzyme S subunit